MKNMLLKFAGFFVERVPIEEPVGQPPASGGANAAAGVAPAGQHPATVVPLEGSFPPPGPTPGQPAHAAQPAQAHPQQGQAPGQAHAQQPLAVALRAWVPQEYGSYMAPYGLHVIAAGGELTAEQARTYGAQVLVVSSECLGSDTHLLTNPQVPTIFVAPQPVTLPDVPGVVQVQEPLHASELAAAARGAVAAWAGAHR